MQHDQRREPTAMHRGTPQQAHETEQRALLDLLLSEFPGLLTYREALIAHVQHPRHAIQLEDSIWQLEPLLQTAC